MELASNNKTGAPTEKTIIKKPIQTNVWMPATRRRREARVRALSLIEHPRSEQSQESIGKTHACKACRRGFEEASDHLKRANRDLGETAAFIAASLTTVTAIQAVISIAHDKLELPREVLQLAFNGYIAVFILILLLGAFRASSAIRRRAQAERDIDQAKKGIYEFCPPDQWLKPEG